jgi:hypothetical protein
MNQSNNNLEFLIAILVVVAILSYKISIPFMVWFESVNWIRIFWISLGIISPIILVTGIIYFYKYIERRKEREKTRIEREKLYKKVTIQKMLEAEEERKFDEELEKSIERRKKERKVERKEPPKKVRYKENINITISIDEYRHDTSKLDKHEKRFLKNYGYIQRKYTSIDGKNKDYFIKLRFNESAQHCALTYDLYYFIKNYTDNIELFVTKKPDIVFKINDKNYAIEVETGKIKDWRRLREKAETLNKKYKARWFFVLTNKNLKSRYKKYGPTYDKRNIKKHLLSICNS